MRHWTKKQKTYLQYCKGLPHGSPFCILSLCSVYGSANSRIVPTCFTVILIQAVHLDKLFAVVFPRVCSSWIRISFYPWEPLRIVLRPLHTFLIPSLWMNIRFAYITQKVFYMVEMIVFAWTIIANKSLWIVHKFYAKLIAIIRMIDNIIMISIAGDMTIGCIVWSYLVYGLERLLH